MTAGFVRTSAGRALGDLAAEVEHGDAVGDAHDEAHVVLDEQHRVALVADRADEVHAARRFSAGLKPAAGSSRQQQLRARWPGPGRSRGGAGRRRAGCGRPRRPGRAMPTNSSSSMASARSRRAPRGGADRAGRARRPTLVRWWASAPTITFSSAVISGNSRMFWNVRAMPSLVISYALLPCRAGVPSKRTHAAASAGTRR